MVEHDSLRQISNDIASLATKMDTVHSDLDELKRAVKGYNGEPGLLTRIIILEKSIVESKGFVRWVWPVSISVVSLLVACAALWK